jgi:alpha-ketoglutarate-dependent taurine dioxygenase
MPSFCMQHPVTRCASSAATDITHLCCWQVLVIRGQEGVTPARHVDFSRRFGPLYPHIMDQCVLTEEKMIKTFLSFLRR